MYREAIEKLYPDELRRMDRIRFEGEEYTVEYIEPGHGGGAVEVYVTDPTAGRYEDGMFFIHDDTLVDVLERGTRESSGSGNQHRHATCDGCGWKLKAQPEVPLQDGAAVVDFAFTDAIPGGPKKQLRRAIREHGGDMRSLAKELLYEEPQKVGGFEVADHVTVDSVERALEDLKYELGVEASRDLCGRCKRKATRANSEGRAKITLRRHREDAVKFLFEYLPNTSGLDLQRVTRKLSKLVHQLEKDLGLEVIFDYSRWISTDKENGEFTIVPDNDGVLLVPEGMPDREIKEAFEDAARGIVEADVEFGRW